MLTEANGLLYMRARYYSPDMMRFINEDIVTGDISNSSSLNRYSYVEGNPVSMVDPFGQEAEKSKAHKWIDGAQMALGAVLFCVPGGQAAGVIFIISGAGGYVCDCIIDKKGANSREAAEIHQKGLLASGAITFCFNPIAGVAEMSAGEEGHFAGTFFELNSDFVDYETGAFAGNLIGGVTWGYAAARCGGFSSSLASKISDNLNLKEATNRNTITGAKTYYQVTSYENAQRLINDENPALRGQEFKEVYVWTEQPTYE